MIILSHTNLSGINLGGINLSEIKLGMPSGKDSGGEETFDPASFDEAWTVTGKTNDDEDRATVKNLTGNGNDLVLSNFAFAGDSGYGLYHASFYEKTDIEFYSKSKVSFSKAQLDAQPYELTTIIAPLTSESGFNIKIKVNGLKEGVRLKWGWIASYMDITEDGIHILEKPENDIRRLIINFDSEFDPNHIITIEQIPDYEGYLVTDGVDDSVRSYFSFNLENNWTIVGDWKLLSSVYKAAGIVKPNQFYIYNDKTSLNLYVKQDKEGFNYNKKTFCALTSDGKIYDDNWNETLVDPVGTSVDILSKLSIGSNGNNYVQMIFKNLAIYNCILTKDQCIKAYNYLQTLK